MIARVWKGTTRASQADEYLEYLKRTGLEHCRNTPGNRGVSILRKVEGDRAYFVFTSRWESWEAIQRFAGPEPEKAVYYPEDRAFLLALEPQVRALRGARGRDGVKALTAPRCGRTPKRVRPAYERWLKRLVEIPTVSSDPDRTARRRPRRRGRGRAHREPGRPRARREDGRASAGDGRVPRTPKGAPTLTLYNHLDVQPADREAEGWRTEPFRFVERDGRYFGRGTTDDKGPALAALFGVAAARAAGVPVTVKLLWETEEEISSPNFERTLQRLGPQRRHRRGRDLRRLVAHAQAPHRGRRPARVQGLPLHAPRRRSRTCTRGWRAAPCATRWAS